MATTENMGLITPTVGSTPGPEWATLLNAEAATIDAHDHTEGKGARLPSSAFNINADLPFGNNSPTGMRSAQFTSQTAALTGLESALYFLDGDLYAIDGDGNAIQMTVGGVIASGVVGNISGLTSPATAAYAASTFTWKATATLYATMAGGPVSLRRGDEASPNAITLQPAASTATQTLTLPAALPGASAFVTIDASGNLGYTPALSQGITRAMQAAVGQITSTATVGTTKTNTSAAVYSTLSLSITTTGRPVIAQLITPAGTDSGTFTATNGVASTQAISWYFDVDGAVGKFGQTNLPVAASSSAWLPLSSISALILGLSAGTHTVSFYAFTSNASCTYALSYVQLVAVEM